MLIKPKGSPVYVFRHYVTFSERKKFKNFKFFSKKSLFTETTKTTQATSGQCKLSAKGPPFIFFTFLRNLQNRTRPKGPPFTFLALCEFFFQNFLMSQKSPPSSFFFIFCNRTYVNEFQSVSRFHFSALGDISR